MAQPTPVSDSVGRTGGLIDPTSVTALGFLKGANPETLTGGIGKALELVTNQAARDWKTTGVTVGTSAAAAILAASALALRRLVIFQNADPASSVYVGKTSAVTTISTVATAGLWVPPLSFVSLSLGPAVDIYAIATAASTNLIIVELA